MFLLNCPWDMEGIEKHLPGQVKSHMANHNIKFYVTTVSRSVKEIDLADVSTRCFRSQRSLNSANIIPEEEAISLMKAAAKATLRKTVLTQRTDELR